MKYILKNRLKYYTKEIIKYFNIAIIAFGLIIAIILIKYRPIYKVSIDGQEVGYVKNIQSFEENLKEDILGKEDNNIDSIDILSNQNYELKLVSKTTEINEDEIINKLEENIAITYKYYEITYKNEVIEKVDTIEEAEQLVEQIKLQNSEEAEYISIIEKITENEEEIITTDIEVAKTNIKENLDIKIQEITKQKEEEERIKNLPSINGIKIAVTPVEGIITSRYGVSSRIRVAEHTGLDIAATTGTPIKVVADGKITFSGYSGSYGYIVKIDHGNGVETWYAHASKLYAKVGQEVKAGETIALVGSTGNSTGPHLHLEIRINGQHVNPQQYLYK